jgi:hypothetical protein
VRKVGGRADVIGVEDAGVEGSWPGGLPAIATVQAHSADELEPELATDPA